jgi:cysteine sulfinate desulfinase/cysteine desulfurase-like protein
MTELYHHLTSRGVHLSVRKGVLRMSLGLYNDLSDVNATVAFAREWTEQRPR